MTIATVAAVVGIGAGGLSIYDQLKANKAGGGGAGGSTYIPTGQAPADQQWQDMMNAISSQQGTAGGKMQPAMDASLAQMLGIDTSGLTKAGAAAGQQYGGLSNLAQMYSQIMGNQAGVNQQAQGNLMGAGNQLWQTALDPQKQLQQQLQQQVTDASRAGTSARGIGMSGESAGIENQDINNFLINWQNQQLGRQSTGLQGMTSAYQQAGQQGQDVGQMLTGSLAAGSMAPQFTQASGQVPFDMSQTAAMWPMLAANQYGSSMNANMYGPEFQMMSQIIPYLYAGQGATGQAFGQQQTNLNNLTTGMQQFGQNAPNAWSALSNIFNPQPNYSTSGGTGSSGTQDLGSNWTIPG